MAIKQLKIEKKITDRNNACLDSYLSEICKYQQLTPEEEIELTKMIKKGDERAKEKLIKSNLRFVVSVAKQYMNFGVELLDLINEGNIGIIIAAERFDETKGFKFISYAVWWIRQKILASIPESRLIRLPQNKNANLIAHRDAINLLEQKLERTPTNEELFEHLSGGSEDYSYTDDMNQDEKEKINKKVQNKLEEISNLKEISKTNTSLDGKINSDDDSQTLGEVIKNENSLSPDICLMENSFKEDINRVLNNLSKKEKVIIEMLFGLNGKTESSIESIAFEFEFTTERIRQIKNKALEDMKNLSGDLLLKYF